MTWLLIYLGVGLLNVAHAGVRRRLILTTGARRRAGNEWPAGLAEVAFYLLLWPAQVLWFVVFICIPAFIEWAYNKIAGE